MQITQCRLHTDNNDIDLKKRVSAVRGSWNDALVLCGIDPVMCHDGAYINHSVPSLFTSMPSVISSNAHFNGMSAGMSAGMSPGATASTSRKDEFYTTEKQFHIDMEFLLNARKCLMQHTAPLQPPSQAKTYKKQHRCQVGFCCLLLSCLHIKFQVSCFHFIFHVSCFIIFFVVFQQL